MTFVPVSVDVDAVADELADAWAQGRPAAPGTVPEGLGLADAYIVQARAAARLERRGWRVGGVKAGAASTGAMARLGIDEPLFGRLVVPDAAPAKLLDPKVEPEIALTLAAAVAAATVEGVLAAVGSVHLALEIADSRVAWTEGASAMVADGCSAGQYVLGPGAPPPSEIANIAVTWSRDGEVLAHTDASRAVAEPGGPVGPLAVAACAARWAQAHGRPLGAGDVVLTGALAPAVALRPGERHTVTSPVLGTVELELSAR